MQYQTRSQLAEVAEIDSRPFPALLTRAGRLNRWAVLLNREPSRLLATLYGTEFSFGRTRAKRRVDNSPISVAFADPALRACGLRDDTYGEARRFFDLTDRDLHDILCYCHLGEAVSGAMAARHVRAASEKRGPGTGVMGYLRNLLA
ncbi:MAG: hypothetical protein U1E56_06705 [Bauldia sp.]